MTDVYAVFPDGHRQIIGTDYSVEAALRRMDGYAFSSSEHGTATQFAFVPDRGEVDNLKRQWRSDPCWDIYSSRGFEHYEAELRAYQAEWEQRWEEQRQLQLAEKAQKLGCPGNLALAEYVFGLEQRLELLERKVFE